MQEPVATWSGKRDCWMKGPKAKNLRVRTTTLLEHWGVYSGIFMKRGMMRRGQLFEVDLSKTAIGIMSGLPTNGNESLSSLPTPRTTDSNVPGHHGAGGVDLRTEINLLPTVYSINNDNRKSEGYGPALGNVLNLLPTPTRQDGENTAVPSQFNRNTSVVNDMGGNKTPGWWEEKVKEWGETHENNGHGKSLPPEARYNFHQYQAAIDRWTRIFGTPPPPPTEMSKQGKRVLNPAFAEWMMGFPRGWVTEAGISRTNQLKALGNAVVPQQGAEALKRLRGVLEAR